MLAKTRRIDFRERVPRREMARRTGLSRNTIRRRLRQIRAPQPKVRQPLVPGVIHARSARRRDALAEWRATDPLSTARGARLLSHSPPA